MNFLILHIGSALNHHTQQLQLAKKENRYIYINANEYGLLISPIAEISVNAHF